MSAPSKDSLSHSSPGSTPLKRFLGFIRPYRRLLSLAALCGIVRYLIPLSLPWAVKILLDDFLLVQGSRPRSQIHLLMLGLCALYAFYGAISYWRSYLAGLVGHSVILDLRQALYRHVIPTQKPIPPCRITPTATWRTPGRLDEGIAPS